MVASGSYFVNVRYLPVVQLAKVEQVINPEYTETLGLTIPHSLLIRADEVIR